MGHKEDEAAIRAWLFNGASPGVAKRGRGNSRTQAERERQRKEALAQAEFDLFADELQMAIRDRDPYMHVTEVKSVAASWGATGLTPQDAARWLRAGADPRKPSLVVQFRAAKVPLKIAFSKVMRGGHPTGETYYQLASYGEMHPKTIYELAVKSGIIEKAVG